MCQIVTKLLWSMTSKSFLFPGFMSPFGGSLDRETLISSSILIGAWHLPVQVSPLGGATSKDFIFFFHTYPGLGQGEILGQQVSLEDPNIPSSWITQGLDLGVGFWGQTEYHKTIWLMIWSDSPLSIISNNADILISICLPLLISQLVPKEEERYVNMLTP